VKKIQLSIFATVSGIIILILSTIPSIYASDNIIPAVFPPDSKPYGLTYGEWSTKWWKWYVSIPQDSNPANDDTGKNCAIGQKDTNVWFLAGTGGGSAERSCAIPARKSILFPIINAECSYATDPIAKTEPEMRACAMSASEGASVQATVDGKQLQNLDKYRVQSPLFNVTFPENNVFGVKAGFTPMLSDGWWILLEPLAAGNHNVHFSGVVRDNPTTGTKGFATETTYHLKVNP
jgi:hypothetical protein